VTIEALYRIFQQYPSIQTDSRKLKAGDLFFALKGPSFNGNQFALRAIETGAAYAVIDEPQEGDSNRLILVDDVYKPCRNWPDFTGFSLLFHLLP
jgi:UDP-N-acetylmuramoyl-tripeptide--D-alanyl-D-alanine ligase